MEKMFKIGDRVHVLYEEGDLVGIIVSDGSIGQGSGKLGNLYLVKLDIGITLEINEDDLELLDGPFVDHVFNPNETPEKKLIIQERKENGIEEALLNGFASYLTDLTEKNKRFHHLLRVSVWVPVCDGTNNTPGKSFQLPVSPEEVNKDHSELLDICFNSIYHFVRKSYGDIWYFLEPVKNLPAWSDSILQKDGIDHIAENLTLYGRVKYFLNDWRNSYIKYEFSLNDNEFAKIQKSITEKLAVCSPIDRTEEKIVEYLLKWNHKDLFPHYMSTAQIIKAVRDAYEDARKSGKRQFPTPRDEKNSEGSKYGWRSRILYQGQSGELTIRFWFDCEDNEIVTAYPTFSSRKPIKRDKQP